MQSLIDLKYAQASSFLLSLSVLFLGVTCYMFTSENQKLLDSHGCTSNVFQSARTLGTEEGMVEYTPVEAHPRLPAQERNTV